MLRRQKAGVLLAGFLGACGGPSDLATMAGVIPGADPGTALGSDDDPADDARELVDPGIRLARGYTDCLTYPSGTATCWRRAPVHTRFLWDLPDIDDAVAVTHAHEHGCVLRATGNLWCWGYNHHSQMGYALPRLQGTDVPLSLGNVLLTKIATSHHAMCGIRPSGQAVCWGGNYDGPLGDPAVYESPSEVEVLGVPDAIDISASMNYSCALRRGGQVWCWGDRTLPAPVPDVDRAIQIDVSPSQACALRDDGSVRCWTWDTRVPGVTPSRTIAGLRGIVQITSACGRRKSGRVQCWWDSSTAVRMADVADATDLATHTGSLATCATKSDTTTVCWDWGSTSLRPFPPYR